MILAFFLINGLFTVSARAQSAEVQETIYQDALMTVLAPTLNSATDEYYKTILREMPGFGPSEAKIINIQRPNGDRTAYFLIEIEVAPYLGPHITVGRDRILLELKYGSPPQVLAFEHLEDYPLPEHYRALYLHR